MILNNRAKCLKCNDVIYSAYTHDFKECSCGNVFVDGGMSYVRHGWKDKSIYQDLSIEIADSLYYKLKSELKMCDDAGKNNLGKICAIFRVLQDEEINETN